MDRSIGKARVSRKQRLGEAARKAKPARASGRGRVPRVVKVRGVSLPVPANDTQVAPPGELLMDEAALEGDALTAAIDAPSEETSASEPGAEASVDLEAAEDTSADEEDSEPD